MRTLQFGPRMVDRDRSLAFYTAVGYEVVGRVPDTAYGELTMLKLPDDDFVMIELVHDPNQDIIVGNVLNHIIIQIESMDATIAELGARGTEAEVHTDFTSTGISEWAADGWLHGTGQMRSRLVRHNDSAHLLAGNTKMSCGFRACGTPRGPSGLGPP